MSNIFTDVFFLLITIFRSLHRVIFLSDDLHNIRYVCRNSHQRYVMVALIDLSVQFRVYHYIIYFLCYMFIFILLYLFPTELYIFSLYFSEVFERPNFL